MRRVGLMLLLPLLAAATGPSRLKVIGSPGEWVTPDDYPKEVLNARRVGVTAFSLTVGVDGRPTRCDITGSSGTDQLDQAACAKLMERARFEPQRNDEGTPVESVYRNRVRWMLPGNVEPFPAYDASIEFDLGVDGVVSNCRAVDAMYAVKSTEACDAVAKESLLRIRSPEPVHIRMRSSTEVEPLSVTRKDSGRSPN